MVVSTYKVVERGKCSGQAFGWRCKGRGLGGVYSAAGTRGAGVVCIQQQHMWVHEGHTRGDGYMLVALLSGLFLLGLCLY